MLLLLPPSETKRPGGVPGSRLDLASLRFPTLTDARRRTLDAVSALAQDHDAAVAALKLGPRQHGEVAKNRVLEASPVMPAVDRYTGVLYDALDAGGLPEPARERLGRAAVVHSAVLGPIGALDPIPDYRLSHDARLPGARLKQLWAEAAAAALAREDGLIVDARSQGYSALGPLPRRHGAVRLEVVAEDGAGRRRALNHFNKHAKGRLARAVALASALPGTVGELIEWSREQGLRLEAGEPAADGIVDTVTLVTAGPS
ncbi:YaaA family protein [Gryllotalpicola ginsengisoli]|uniref:YaaA family protein n=1 Tax=Gryllotalpicola ginsengisoli TaxID=444608 RepID=UPI0003B4DAEB|nr:peroxide stress protein YaaA [Gryllotalpicola ginsengisoli]